MTYRAWNLKPLDRAALRELTQAIAEQATEELEYNAQNDEPWSEQKYAAALAAQQKENALLAGVLTARGITDPTEALTLLAGEEELSDPSLLTDMDKACERIWRAIDEGETIVVFGDYDVDGATSAALLFEIAKEGFGYYIAHYGTYKSIYGALAGIPIMMIWLYMSWLVVLLGAEFTATLGEWQSNRTLRGNQPH